MHAFIWAAVFPAFLASLSAGFACAQFTNTLQNNGRWLCSKLELEMTVVGSVGFYTGPQALAGGRLNLGTWQGYQEVIYKEALDPEEIEFRVYPSSDSYIYFVFNKDESGFSAFRLSTNPRFPNAFLTADAGGGFRERSPLNTDEFRTNRWSRCRIRFHSDFCSVEVNDEPIGEFPKQADGNFHFGFRGGLRDVLVDDIVIHAKNPDRVLRETFFDWKTWRAASFIFLILFLLPGLAILVRRPGGKRAAFGVFLVNVVLLFSTSVASMAVWILAPRYPSPGSFFARYGRGDSFRRVLPPSSEVSASQITEKPAYDILFLGASQTWGAGAETKDGTFPRLVEKELNGSLKSQFQVINLSVPGADSGKLLADYPAHLNETTPEMTVINLTHNEVDEKAFGVHLEEFLRINRARDVQTVFVLEANSADFPAAGVAGCHAVLRSLAEKHGIPLIDLHGALLKEYDSGILWWDNVHLTPYGHRLAADHIAKRLKEILKTSR